MNEDARVVSAATGPSPEVCPPESCPPEVYLLDVEGTIAPLTLVTDKLFPYARRRLREFVTGHAADLAGELQLLAAERAGERAGESNSPRGEIPAMSDAADLSGAVAYLDWLMVQDRKSTALKAIQGQIWREGFEAGELVGELFPDVPGAIERWGTTGRVAIYSSGSVEAQRLLLRYSNFGDLSALVVAHFDTRIGAKGEAASYLQIAQQLEVAPEAILFFSDVVRELDAARLAGCQTRLVVRPANAPVAAGHGHAVVTTLDGC